jgi:peptidoglycan/LPS O-acetylase OafA/YrhL
MMQATSTTDRRPELDGLRALAIIAVFLAHYFACMPVPGAYCSLSSPVF